MRRYTWDEIIARTETAIRATWSHVEAAELAGQSARRDYWAAHHARHCSARDEFLAARRAGEPCPYVQYGD